MPSKRRRSRKESTESFDDDWRKHDIYDLGVARCSPGSRILTRSQAAFIKLKNTESDIKLFSDARRHHPPGLPHLITTLKGPLGAIPRTIVTENVAKYYPVSEKLCERVDLYKTAKLTGEDDEKNRRKSKSRRRSSRRRA